MRKPVKASLGGKDERTHNLLLRVLGARDEVDSLHVPNVDGITENRGENDF